MKTVIGSRPPLVKNLLFVEGFGRGGKLLLGNIINGFDGIEPIQYYGLLEHIPFLEKFKLIDTKTAQELIRCEIDTHCYEMLIGRNFNYRKYDGSSIFKIPGYKKLLRRSSEKDTDKNLKRFYKNNTYSFFMMHELMPNIKIYFDTFPHLKVISIKRNPVDIVYSWYKRNIPKRFGKDPKIFMIPIKGAGGPVPWFMHRYKDQYHSLLENDRLILSTSEVFRMYKNAYQQLPSKLKNRILFIPFEELVFRHTDLMLKTIGKFLNRKPLPKIGFILKREGVPRSAIHGKICRSLEEKFMCTECKLAELKKVTSKKYFNLLVKLRTDYESGKTY